MTLFHACCCKCRTTFFVLLILFIGPGMPLSTMAADAPARVSAGPEPREQPVVLDEAALKAAIAHRLRTARESKDERFAKFTPDQVDIEGTIPVHTPETTYFAVKLKILPVTPEARPEFITLVVDQTGTMQIGSIQDLAKGTNLMKAAVDRLQTVDIKDLPPGFGKEIFSGTGPHTIIAISDPFCPHCRQAWDHIKLNLEKIKTLRLAHFPLNKASEAACLVMADAFARQIQLFDVIDFTYSLLDKTRDPQKIIARFMEVFPKLAQTWGDDPASALAYLTQMHQNSVRTEQNTIRALGIHSTPVFFVNDTFIKGFDAQKAELLP
ncbi:MAG: thioredoxin domain-containing protein [Desulfotignum sp.]|nr:thioredoxin domain-containing protein [Desulfotignum sp.]